MFAIKIFSFAIAGLWCIISITNQTDILRKTWEKPYYCLWHQKKLFCFYCGEEYGLIFYLCSKIEWLQRVHFKYQVASLLYARASSLDSSYYLWISFCA